MPLPTAPTPALISLMGSLLIHCGLENPSIENMNAALRELRTTPPTYIRWRRFFSPEHVFMAAVRCHKLGLDHSAIIHAFTNWPYTFWRSVPQRLDAAGLAVAEELIAVLADEKERQEHLNELIGQLIVTGALDEALQRIPRLEWLHTQCTHRLELAKKLRQLDRHADAQQQQDLVLSAVRERRQEIDDKVIASDDILQKLAIQWAEEGRPEETLPLVDIMTTAHARCDTLIEVAHRQRPAEERDGAYKTYRRAAQTAFDPEIEYPQAYTHWIAAGIAAMGMDEQADQILPLQWMVGQGHACDTLVRTLAEAGRHQHALELLKDLQDPWQRCENLLTVARAIRRSGDEAEAQKIVDEALSILPASRIGADHCVPAQVAFFGRIDEALALVKGVEEELIEEDEVVVSAADFQALAQEAVLMQMVQDGHAERALELVRTMDDEQARTLQLMDMACILRSAGDRVLAHAVAEEAWQAAHTVDASPYQKPATEFVDWLDDDSQRGYLFNRLKSFFEDDANWEDAQHVLEEMAELEEVVLE